MLCLVILVQTDWYSKYFNNRMAAELLESYRMTGAKHDIELLAAARRFSGSAAHPTNRSLHTDEEFLILSSSMANPVAVPSSDSQPLELWLLRKDVSIASKNVAYQKLLRQNLLLADTALKAKNVGAAEDYLDKFLHNIQRMRSPGYGPGLRLIERYLVIRAKLAAAQGKADEQKQLLEDKDNLADPDFAKAWYRLRGIHTYDADYSGDYRVQWALQNSAVTANAGSAFAKALTICEDPQVPSSTRLEVLQYAVNLSIQNKDTALKTQALKTWTKIYYQSIPRTTSEANIIKQLLSIAVEKQEKQLGCRLMLRLFQSYDAGLISPRVDRTFLESAHRFYAYLHETIPDVTVQKDMLETQTLMERVCRENKLDDTGAKLTKLSLLTAAAQNHEALALAEELFPRKEVYLNYAEPIFFDCVMRLSPRRNSTDTQRSALERLHYVESLDKKGSWSATMRIHILLTECNILREIPDDFAWKKTLVASEQVFALAKPMSSNLEIQELVFSHKLSMLTRTFRFDEATSEYKAIKRICQDKQEFLYKLCDKQAALWRAVPSYSAAGLSAAKEDKYPYQCLVDACALTKKYRGATSDEYAKTLLWLAQYEYCRDNKSAAAKYCSEILQAFSPTSTRAYLPAADLADQIAGKSLAIPTGGIKAHEGTKVELDCQRSIYFSMHNAAAGERIGRLIPLVEEI